MYICVSVHVFVHICPCSVFTMFAWILLTEHDILGQYSFVVPETTFLLTNHYHLMSSKLRKTNLKHFVIIVSKKRVAQWVALPLHSLVYCLFCIFLFCMLCPYVGLLQVLLFPSYASSWTGYDKLLLGVNKFMDVCAWCLVLAFHIRCISVSLTAF